MAIVINTNVASLNAQRNLNNTQFGLSKALERLSSGYRINRAGDDAAGLAISERFKAQIRSTSQASRNTLDGVSLVQVSEGAYNEISNILIRLRELAVQSANGTISASDRTAIDTEYDQLTRKSPVSPTSSSSTTFRFWRVTALALRFRSVFRSVSVRRLTTRSQSAFSLPRQVSWVARRWI